MYGGFSLVFYFYYHLKSLLSFSLITLEPKEELAIRINSNLSPDIVGEEA